MTRTEILEAARKCVCGDREQDYGSPENNFRTIADLWEVYLRRGSPPSEGVTILPEDVAAMLALLKIARIASGHAKEDNWVDLAGYAACGGEIQTGVVLPKNLERELATGKAYTFPADILNGVQTNACTTAQERVLEVDPDAAVGQCPYCGAYPECYYVEKDTGNVVGCDGCIDEEVFASGHCRSCGEEGAKAMYFVSDDHGCVGCSMCMQRVGVDAYDDLYGDCEANHKEDEAVERFYENR